MWKCGNFEKFLIFDAVFLKEKLKTQWFYSRPVGAIHALNDNDTK